MNSDTVVDIRPLDELAFKLFPIFDPAPKICAFCIRPVSRLGVPYKQGIYFP